ncbi:MAG: hypothetical protein MUQ32_04820 [Chloroflexi bacterium]|nr:hypothetical protein [Chloroflexota bacterium]
MAGARRRSGFLVDKIALMAMHVVGYAAIIATLFVGHARAWLGTGIRGTP